MSVRGFGGAPQPNGGGMPYGQQQQMYSTGPPQLMDPNNMQLGGGGGGLGMGPRQSMPPGAYNRGTRMEHVANNTLSNRSFGTILPGTHKESELNSGVVRQIQMDWDNRQYLEAITLGIKKIADFLNKFNLSCQTRLAFLNERLSHLERQLDYIQAKVPKAAAQQPPSNNQSHA